MSDISSDTRHGSDARRDSDTIGIVWNPSKVEERELRDAVDRALDAYVGTGAETLQSGSVPSGSVPSGSVPSGSPERPTVLWFETSEDDPGRGMAEEALAQGCTVVIAAGGDGTVRSVADALGSNASGSDSSPRADLGIVPLGTGNLLARNLGVPLGNIQAAVTRVLTEAAQPLDLGSATLTFANGDEQHEGFVVMVGFGIDAHMIAETDDDLKAKAGWLAYVESLGRALSHTEVIDFTLTIDGADAQPEQAHTMLVANCGMLQGGITLLPDAQPDDGELDLLVLRADGVGAWLDTVKNFTWDNGIKRFLTGGTEAESSDSTAHLRARTVRIDFPAPHVCEVDGDDMTDVVAIETQILPAALRVR